ncbi:MAG: alanine--glyoxylate aminotransferase family protein [Candidatus Omnitrophica bacterium]|nr:alanine--glyoxylate aminotransferase family protein [Candidatus Omnitrophota bacterium]
MRKNYLLTPGPTPLPPQVCEAMSRPIIHHRTPQFQAVLKEALEGLKYVYQTKNDIFILASSGTGAMETAVVNLLSPGDTAIVAEAGKFGERWTELCKAYGINAEVIKVPWGQAPSAKEIKVKIEALKPKVVFATLCETSTGAAADIKAIGEVVKASAAVLVVDAISGLGAIDIQTDNWSVDVVVSGSQKGLMLPPGLAFLSVSPKAWDLVTQSKSPRYYFDLKAAKKALDKTDTPYTPAVTLVIALNEALKMMRQDGLENTFARHKKMADATRAALTALGMELFTTQDAISDAVTAARVPQGIDGEKLVKTMRDTYGITIAGGQSELKGKVIRVAHMGFIEEFDIIAGISCLEKVLKQMGHKFELGAGVKAAQEVFLK